MPDTEHIGKYEILEELGRGGFATVYKANDPTLDRLVALKVLHPNWLADPEFSTRFRNEARAVANLDHPHIVVIHEIDDTDGLLYIAMKYLSGVTLQKYLDDKGPLPLKEALPILEQIAGALDYAHSKGIVHRDIKPANIMVEETEDGLQVTLTDFGLVKILSESNAFTITGDILGSPEYMAPEQADPNRASEIGPATDLYALGVLAYRMLIGRVPFPGSGSTHAVLYGHLNLDPPDPLEFVPDLSPDIATVLLKMLAKTPGDRYPSAKQFVGQLGYIIEHRQSRFEQGSQSILIPAIPTWGWGIVGVFILVLFLIINPGGLLDNWGLSPEVTKIAMPSLTPSSSPTFTSLPTQIAKPSLTPSLTPIVTTSPTQIAIPEDQNKLPEGEFEAGYTWTRPIDGMELVYVPDGEFEMGSESGDDDESPVHTVKLDAFWIDKTEVTNGQFAEFLNASVVQSGSDWLDVVDEDCLIELVAGSYQPKTGYETHPVVEVSWYGAEAYCEWVGGELPTEAEWEYAAKGPENLVYPWGNEWREKYANCDDDVCKDGYEGTSPVGSFPEGASWCKVLDMSGNVWEWVADWYGDYPSERLVNPLGPDSGTSRVLRSGSWWLNNETDLRCATRTRINSTDSDDGSGFRCAAGSSRGE